MKLEQMFKNTKKNTTSFKKKFIKVNFLPTSLKESYFFPR